MFDLKKLTPDQKVELALGMDEGLDEKTYNLVEEKYPTFGDDRSRVVKGNKDKALLDAFKKAEIVEGTPATEAQQAIVERAMERYYGLSLSDFDVLQKKHDSIKPNEAALLQQGGENTDAFIEKALNAKREVFATDEGRQALLKGYKDALEVTRSSDNRFYWGAMSTKDRFVQEAEFSPIVKLMHTEGEHDDASPAAFIRALEGGESSRDLKHMLNQARELAYIQNKPLGDAVEERFAEVFGNTFQPEKAKEYAKVFGELTRRFEKGEDVQHLQNLANIHGDKVAELEAARAEHHRMEQERITAENVARKRANEPPPAEPTVEAPAAHSPAPAVEPVAAAPSAEHRPVTPPVPPVEAPTEPAAAPAPASEGHAKPPAEPKTPPAGNAEASLTQKAENMLKKFPGKKWGAAAAGAAVVTAGVAWAVHAKNKKAEAEERKSER